MRRSACAQSNKFISDKWFARNKLSISASSF